jgi:hypothetical protein
VARDPSNRLQKAIIPIYLDAFSILPLNDVGTF